MVDVPFLKVGTTKHVPQKAEGINTNMIAETEAETDEATRPLKAATENQSQQQNLRPNSYAISPKREKETAEAAPNPHSNSKTPLEKWMVSGSATKPQSQTISIDSTTTTRQSPTTHFQNKNNLKSIILRHLQGGTSTNPETIAKIPGSPPSNSIARAAPPQYKNSLSGISRRPLFSDTSTNNNMSTPDQPSSNKMNTIILLSSSDEEDNDDRGADLQKLRSQLNKDDIILANIIVRQNYRGNPRDHVLFQSLKLPTHLYPNFINYIHTLRAQAGENSEPWPDKKKNVLAVKQPTMPTVDTNHILASTLVSQEDNKNTHQIPKRAKKTARKSAGRKLVMNQSVLESCTQINERSNQSRNHNSALQSKKPKREKNDDSDSPVYRSEPESDSNEDYPISADVNSMSTEARIGRKKRRQNQIDYNEDALANGQVVLSTSASDHGLGNGLLNNTLDLEAMNDIPFLRRYQICDGLPKETVSVHSSDGNYIYEFEFSAAQSLIPHGGYGAFLKLTRVFKLKQHLRKKRKKCFDGTDLREVQTQRPLLASHPNGHGVEVALTGQNLHGNFNSKFWPKEAVMVASNDDLGLRGLKWEAKNILVNVVGRNLFYDAEEESRMQRQNSFGSLRQHMWQDYERVPENIASFSSRYPGCGFVKLGRYGPFRKEDRKQKDDYDLKTFVFDQEPSGWSFGVSEEIRGAKQIVDITDDITGETHKLAESQIPMYVNECGNNPHLTQNVHSREENDRNVIYYVDLRNAIKIGVSVELLTDYFSHYELVRTRKGYGKDNIRGTALSDGHEASRLKRDCKEREDMASLVRRLTPTEVFYRLEFLNERIRIPLDNLLCGGDSQNNRMNEITPRQFKARVRLNWLAHLFLEHVTGLESLKSTLELPQKQKSMVPDQGKSTVVNMLQEAKRLAESLQWSSMVAAANRSENWRAILEGEIVEEMMYSIGNTIPFAMDQNVWCPMARQYIKRVLIDVSPFVKKGKGIHCEDFVEIFKVIRKCTSDAVASIEKQSRGSDLELLSFSHGSEGSLFINPAENTHLCEYGVDGNSPIFKGALSALADFRAQCGSSEVATVSRRLEVHERVVMTVGTEDRFMNPHRGYPRLPQHGLQINTQWYAVWQAVYPLYQIGKGLLRLANLESASHFEEVLLRLLCDAAELENIKEVELLGKSFSKSLQEPRTTFEPAPILSFDPSAVPVKKSRTPGPWAMVEPKS